MSTISYHRSAGSEYVFESSSSLIAACSIMSFIFKGYAKAMLINNNKKKHEVTISNNFTDIWTMFIALKLK